VYPFALKYRATSSAAEGSISSDCLHTYGSIQVIALDGEADMSHVDIVASVVVLMKGRASLIDSAALIPPPHDLAEVSEVSTGIRHTSKKH